MLSVNSIRNVYGGGFEKRLELMENGLARDDNGVKAIIKRNKSFENGWRRRGGEVAG